MNRGCAVPSRVQWKGLPRYDVAYPSDSKVRNALTLPQNSCSNAVGHAADLWPAGEDGMNANHNFPIILGWNVTLELVLTNQVNKLAETLSFCTWITGKSSCCPDGRDMDHHSFTEGLQEPTATPWHCSIPWTLLGCCYPVWAWGPDHPRLQGQLQPSAATAQHHIVLPRTHETGPAWPCISVLEAPKKSLLLGIYLQIARAACCRAKSKQAVQELSAPLVPPC